MKALQAVTASYLLMKNWISSQRQALIITVYEDGDTRSVGDSWQAVGDTVYMSDDLYAMYCQSLCVENVNCRQKVA